MFIVTICILIGLANFCLVVRFTKQSVDIVIKGHVCVYSTPVILFFSFVSGTIADKCMVQGIKCCDFLYTFSYIKMKKKI